MKKYLSLLLVLLMVICTAGCGSEETDSTIGKSDSTKIKKVSKKADTVIDVDLTALSSTMVYSEVYNMMSEPEKYKGKIVKMKGTFSLYYDEANDINYYACIIADATACCQQGIEFVLKGNHKYPDEYPELGTEITVIGKFGTYMDGDTEYCRLAEAKLL